jgi:hypothetical protein
MNFKNFQLYEPEQKLAPGVLYLKDEKGSDWYEIQKKFAAETLKVAYDSEGYILSSSYDVSMLWPVGLSVAEIPVEEIPSDFKTSGKWCFQNGKIFPVAEDPVATAEAEKSHLMLKAAEKIAPLQDAVDLGIATGEEIERLKVWKTFRVELSRVDATTAPHIKMPTLPAL